MSNKKDDSTQSNTPPELRRLLELQEEGDQDDLYPWFQLVQWGAESSQHDVVLVWDLESTWRIVNNLTSEGAERFLECVRMCRKEGAEIESQEFSLNEDKMVFVDWAGALLGQLTSLREIRYVLVPRAMTEEEFWRVYFSLVRHTIEQFLKEQQGRYLGSKEESDGSEDEEISTQNASTDTPTVVTSSTTTERAPVENMVSQAPNSKSEIVHAKKEKIATTFPQNDRKQKTSEQQHGTVKDKGNTIFS